MKRKPISGERFQSERAELIRQAKAAKQEAFIWRNAFAIFAHGSKEYGVEPNANVKEILEALDKYIAENKNVGRPYDGERSPYDTNAITLMEGK